MIQMPVYALAMTVIYLVIHRLHNKDNLAKGEISSRYIIRIPSVLPATYSIMFWMGLALFVMFGFFYLIGTGGVTIGHFIFALVCSGIGLLVVIWSSHWRITVDGDTITIHRLFRKEQSLRIEDINATRQEKETKMGASARIVLRHGSKKLISVSSTCENYSPFEEALIRAGKLQKKKK
ncbi:MAG: hypothetical protein LUI39_01480 [Lachnospiraceae bacterium]|nr:hypothetical protein [Lachnospiraceae bacterium]